MKTALFPPELARDEPPGMKTIMVLLRRRRLSGAWDVPKGYVSAAVTAEKPYPRWIYTTRADSSGGSLAAEFAAPCNARIAICMAAEPVFRSWPMALLAGGVFPVWVDAAAVPCADQGRSSRWLGSRPHLRPIWFAGDAQEGRSCGSSSRSQFFWDSLA
ncbi:MAG TPA: hypothetical protein VMF30_10505 [Pirellulales bacterium]|nr:hypothetical protein [Pirellulales bacterium]